MSVRNKMVKELKWYLALDNQKARKSYRGISGTIMDEIIGVENPVFKGWS